MAISSCQSGIDGETSDDRSRLAKAVSASAQQQGDNSDGNPLLLLVFKTALGFSGMPKAQRLGLQIRGVG